MKRRQSEQSLHRAVAQYLDAALPADCWWTTFPAGGGGKIRGAQLKAMGLKAGVPDILIMREWNLGPAVLWIELKAPQKAGPGITQRLCHNKLNAVGCHVAVCRSLDDVQETLIGWGIVPKVTLSRRAA